MFFEQIIWDLPDDIGGNYRHIVDGHDVTIEEVEEVLNDPSHIQTTSRSSGLPMVLGPTATGKYVAVVYEEVLRDPFIIRPVTAYPVTPDFGDES